MPLPMARPMRRKNSAQHQFRKRLPAAYLCAARGKRFAVSFPSDGPAAGFTVTPVIGAEVTFSLRTDDARIAKRRQAIASEALERFLEALEAVPEPLNRREREAVAGIAYQNLLKQFENNPGEENSGLEAGWQELESRLDDGLRYFDPRADGSKGPPYNPAIGARLLEPTIALDDLLSSLGILNLPPSDKVQLAEDVALAMREACWTLLRRVQGDYGTDDAAKRFPAFTPRTAARKEEPVSKASSDSLTLDAVFQPWAREHEDDGGAPETRKAWREVLGRFAASCPSAAIGQWTPDNIADWVTQRLSVVKRATIQKQDLPALQAIFDVAKSKGLMPVNPVRAYREGRKKRGAARAGGVDQIDMEGFTDSEAAVLLDEARKQKLADRRWVLWLCALTGSRVSPIMNLRHQDIRQPDGFWSLEITADAGPIKTGESERTIPLHEELIAQGFLEFVKTRKGRRLFFEESRMKADRRNPGKSRLNHLREWVHEVAKQHDLQIGRKHRKDPNHAWRHWFKRTAADAGVPDRVSDAITGHAPASEGAGYAKVTPKQIVEALARIQAPKRASPEGCHGTSYPLS